MAKTRQFYHGGNSGIRKAAFKAISKESQGRSDFARWHNIFSFGREDRQDALSAVRLRAIARTSFDAAFDVLIGIVTHVLRRVLVMCR